MAESAAAAILLIGNELLTGKVRDENGHHLAVVLRRRGIVLREIGVVGDDPEQISAALVRLLSIASLVFTTGGVGPTHDDVTIPAVARALGRPLHRDPRMEAILRAHYGEAITPAALRMADVPQGTRLGPDRGWPVFCLDVAAGELGAGRPPGDAHVYVLPGVPALLRAKVDALEASDELPCVGGWLLRTIHTRLDESDLAEPLARVAAEHPEVTIGSYPRWTSDERGRLRVEVRVTFEARADAGPRLEAARRALLDRLDPALVLPEPDPAGDPPSAAD